MSLYECILLSSFNLPICIYSSGTHLLCQLSSWCKIVFMFPHIMASIYFKRSHIHPSSSFVIILASHFIIHYLNWYIINVFHGNHEISQGIKFLVHWRIQDNFGWCSMCYSLVAITVSTVTAYRLDDQGLFLVGVGIFLFSTTFGPTVGLTLFPIH
jgi:hypothetical protein